LVASKVVDRPLKLFIILQGSRQIRRIDARRGGGFVSSN
jgi:hypothetical protein